MNNGYKADYGNKCKRASPRLLVVDDEKGIRDLIKAEFEMNGYEVTSALNGAQAVEILNLKKFDIVITDIRMPKMDGLTLLEEIKKASPEIEVIITTGFATIETAVQAMRNGAYDFIEKPFELNALVMVIEKALEKKDLKALLAMHNETETVFSALKLNELLVKITGIAANALNADSVIIFLLDESGKPYSASSMNKNENICDSGGTELAENDLNKILRAKTPLIAAGGNNQSKDCAECGSPCAALSCPFSINGQDLGIIKAVRNNGGDSFNLTDIRNISILASHIAQAVHNAKLYEKLEIKIAELEKARKELEQTQGQLVQAEKMAAVGQLAAGIAHEINNPLAGIMGFAELLLQTDGLAGQQKEDIGTILKQSQRCRDIIHNLLLFSRKKINRKEPVSIAGLMESVIQLVRHDFYSSGLSINCSFQDGLPMVFADPSQIQQVFLNIINNARHALENVKTGSLEIKISRKNGNIVILFKDNGCGIKKEDLSHIFDPFFTTKEPGRGTGLGLSISHGIITQHNGIIKVESEPAKGTTFTVEVPEYEEHPDSGR